jgi:muramoyltetrapeptide carboxypeptidase
MQLLKPQRLKKGDTIGIVATSFPFPTNKNSEYYRQYEKGVGELTSMGFKVKEGKNLKKVKWWFAGTPKERAEDINSMFADPQVKAIIVHDGGQSAIAILEYLNYSLIKNNPKPFIGFSDITNIHLALYSQIGLVGFHACLLTYGLGWVWDFLPDKREEGKERLFDILTSTKPPGKIKPLTKWENWKSGKAEGRLIGGNLSMLSSLMGTKYFPKLEDLKGCIFFWETNNIQSYRIERLLYQLKYAGILDVINGMMIGKLPDIKNSTWEELPKQPTPREIVIETLKDYDFPVMGEMDFGHKTVDLPMPIGLKARMDAEKLELGILESAVI